MLTRSLAEHGCEAAERTRRARRIETAVSAVPTGHPDLKKTYGEKVFAPRLAIDWDKVSGSRAAGQVEAGEVNVAF